MQLNPIHATVAELLSNRLFRIPEYQRAYSWQTRQREDLFKDIEEAHRSGRGHFMATIVALSRETRTIGAEEYKIVELVDGQQRVTTLVILLKAIEMALTGGEPQVSKMKSDLADLLVKSDDHQLILLQTNHDSSSVFSDFIRKGVLEGDGIVTASDRNLVNAATECATFVEKWSSTGELVELLVTIRNRLSLIYHELADEATVYRVFEVLNSRGLDVRWIDKTKSQLMAAIFEYIEDEGARKDGLHEMHNAWKDIYRELGLRQDLGNEALRFAGTFALATRPNKILGEEMASHELIEVAGTDLKTLIGCAVELKKIVQKVSALHGDARRVAVTRVAHARFLAIAILQLDLNKEVEDELLGAWERVTFRIFGLGGADTRNKVGEYVRLGYDIAKGGMTTDDIRDAILALGESFSVDEIVGGHKYWDDWYEGRTEELRYLMYRYDEHLAKEAGEEINSVQWAKIWSDDPSKSIEHIAPQSSNRSYIHNVGNLTMLPPRVNSSLKNKSPSDKAERYIYSGLRGTIKVGRGIAKSQKWTKKDVDARAGVIEAFVKSEWSD